MVIAKCRRCGFDDYYAYYVPAVGGDIEIMEDSNLVCGDIVEIICEQVNSETLNLPRIAVNEFTPASYSRGLSVQEYAYQVSFTDEELDTGVIGALTTIVALAGVFVSLLKYLSD